MILQRRSQLDWFAELMPVHSFARLSGRSSLCLPMKVWCETKPRSSRTWQSRLSASMENRRLLAYVHSWRCWFRSKIIDMHSRSVNWCLLCSVCAFFAVSQSVVGCRPDRAWTQACVCNAIARPRLATMKMLQGEARLLQIDVVARNAASANRF